MRRPNKTTPRSRTLKDGGGDAVAVWDVPTRVFHWSVVTLVAVSWISADQGFMRIHLISGISLLVLLLFRILWGIFGSTTARFTNFIHHPREVLNYLRPSGTEGKKHYAGHNPAGGLMVVMLISVLLAQVGSGLFSNDGVNFAGPLALWVSSDASDLFTKIHGLFFNVILILVWMHIVAVFFYLFVKRENLILPMLTGFKRRKFLPDAFELQFTSVLTALLIVVVVACLVRIVLL